MNLDTSVGSIYLVLVDWKVARPRCALVGCSLGVECLAAGLEELVLDAVIFGLTCSQIAYISIPHLESIIRRGPRIWASSRRTKG